MPIFTKSQLNESIKHEMISKKIWSIECPISLDRLNLLQVSYINFNNESKNDGMLIVHDTVADQVLEIFKTLYVNKFPIQNIKLLNEYDGDDKKSMEDNNTSSFNCRKIENSDKFSIHSYGLAIDINPVQNPFLITELEPNKNSVPVNPANGMQYINRSNVRPGMVENRLNNNESVVDLFKKSGFTIWGGTWNDPIDWHHFQVTRDQAEILAKSSYEEGKQFFINLQKK